MADEKKEFQMNIYDKLTELGITLPPVATPAAAYVPYVQTGNLVFLSGISPRKTASPGLASSAGPWRPKKARPRRVPWRST